MENCWANLGRMNKKQNQKVNPRKLVVLKWPTEEGIGPRYKLGRELGRGEFESTSLCIDKNTGEELACRSIFKSKLKTAVDIENVRREVAILTNLPKHPNIVSLKDVYEDDDHVHLIMELCQGGDLNHNTVVGRYYTEFAAAFIVKTIVQVVQISHKNGVMHRNLQPEHILFAGKKGTSPLKVTDFRLSIFFKPGERFNEIVGSLYYMAPEVIKRNYGPEIDIWSAGVILYILLFGNPPFRAESEQGVAQAIMRSAIDFKTSEHISENAKDLVTKMLEPDPKRRLTAQEVLDHPWFIKVYKKITHEAKYLVKKMLDFDPKRWPTHLEVLDHSWLQNANTAPNVSLGKIVRAKLMQFSVVNELVKTTSTVNAELLFVEVAAKRDRLKAIDIGNEGKINIDELRLRLKQVDKNILDGNVQRLMEAFDEDKDGYLDYGEFLDICIHLRKTSNEKHINRAFEYFDKNQSGYIDLKELCNALGDKVDRNSKKGINAIMNDMDTYKDGRIGYEEVWS